MAVSSQIAEALLEKAVGLQLDALLRRRRREREQWWSDELHRLYPVPSAATVRRFLEVEAAERRREELLGKHQTPLPASKSLHLEALGPYLCRAWGFETQHSVIYCYCYCTTPGREATSCAHLLRVVVVTDVSYDFSRRRLHPPV